MGARARKSAPAVMEIQEARPALPDLVRRAVEEGAVTHIGRRRADEAVVVASARFRSGEEAREILEALSLGPLDVLRAIVAELRKLETGDPFASLRALLAERAAGAAETARTAPVGRRLIATGIAGREEDREPDGITWAGMEALGSGSRARRRDR